MIQEEEDSSILEAIRTLLIKVRYTSAEEDDDLSDQEVAELEERYQEIVSGKVKPHTIDESMRIARGEDEA